MSEIDVSGPLVAVAANIVSAHVSHNAVTAEQLPGLIRDVYRSLTSLDTTTEAAKEELRPAVNPKKSIFPDYLICLEDGHRVKMLKRYIAVRYNLTPEQYRQRWDLPSDYPMVAPSYAQTRSDLAKKIGLGKKPESIEAKAIEMKATAPRRGRQAKQKIAEAA